jgi:HEAT repeat protein
MAQEISHLDTTTLLALARDVTLSDPGRERDERWAAVTELHRRGNPQTFEAAAEWCHSDHPLLRSLGADVLGQLGFDAGHPFAEASTSQLLSLLRDLDPGVTSSALVALGHLRTGEPEAISELATHASAEVRHAVAFCLGGREEAAARETLIRLSRDVDAEVRNWATFALGTLSEADTSALREALIARLTDRDPDVRGEAMRGLAARQDERVVSAILQELQRPDGSELAIEAAGDMPRSEFVAALQVLHASKDAEHVRLALEECRQKNPSV